MLVALENHMGRELEKRKQHTCILRIGETMKQPDGIEEWQMRLIHIHVSIVCRLHMKSYFFVFFFFLFYYCRWFFSLSYFVCHHLIFWLDVYIFVRKKFFKMILVFSALPLSHWLSRSFVSHFVYLSFFYF